MFLDDRAFLVPPSCDYRNFPTILLLQHGNYPTIPNLRFTDDDIETNTLFPDPATGDRL